MPGLYTGQAARIAAGVQQLELLQAADADLLTVTTDPAKRAELQKRMAGRVSNIAARKQALAIATGEEIDTGDADQSASIRIRLTAAQKADLEEKAEQAGKSVSAYVRDACGL